MKALRRAAAFVSIWSCVFALQQAARAEPADIQFVVLLKSGERSMANQFDKLDLGNGSGRYVGAFRQSGKVTRGGLLEGATVLNWGLHEVPTDEGVAAAGTEGERSGGGPSYLVFTLPSGDKLTMRVRMHLQFIPQSTDAPRPFLFGLWQIVGGSGSLSHIEGAGVIKVARPSADVRLWILEGEVGRVTALAKQNSSTQQPSR